MTRIEEQDVALKILHTADWHLGMEFRSFDDDCRAHLTRARLTVVQRLLDLAEQYAVDAVLCAGDLFDDPTPQPEWWEGLAKLFNARRWRDRPVFLLPGNHDPILSRSVYGAEHGFRRALPSWVHVIDRDDFTYELSSEAVLYARPCRSAAGDRDLALALPDRAPGDARIRIGLVHGSTFDIEGCQTNFPIARDAAEQRGLDYLAVGDTHNFREVPPGAKVPTVYPGAPEQTKFDEPDSGCVALVFFRRSGARPIIRRERVGQWVWREQHITELDELRRLASDDSLRHTVLRLTLDLRVSLAEYDETQRLLRELKGSTAAHGRVGVLQLEDANLQVDTSRLDDLKASLPPVLSSVVDRLERAQSEQPDVAQRALYHLYRLVREGGRRASG